MIPAGITTAINYLQAQVQAATPLANASYPTIVALQLNAENLVETIESTLIETSLLDTWVSPIDAPSMIVGVLNILSISEDQQNLAFASGVIGRVSLNLDQL